MAVAGAASGRLVAHDKVGGYLVRSVVADGEPERQRSRALADLEGALPHAQRPEAGAARIVRLCTTPDFHAGKPVPVGVVLDMSRGLMPHVIGNDIGCGMRMIVVHDITEDDLIPALDGHLRHIHFQGGRDIALRGRDRRAILVAGIPGLLDSLASGRTGLLSSMDMDAAWKDVDRTADDGHFAAAGLYPDFDAFADAGTGSSHDAIFGTIGGGNHFVEFGIIDRIEDGAFAQAAQLRSGAVVIVVHSGSLDFGQRVGSAVRERLRANVTRDDNRIVDVEAMPEIANRYRMGLANAANAAFVNRLLIGLASIEALQRALGRTLSHHLVYDAPHNTIWQDDDRFRHRKGACPARGPGFMPGSPYHWLGEPVILPGSMGDGTWLLRGLGSEEALCSAAHGAGRQLSRQEARNRAAVPARLRVVGPVDITSPNIRTRPDIVREIEGRLNEEAPDAYRPIEAVVTPMVEAEIVSRVAKVRPVLTVKG